MQTEITIIGYGTMGKAITKALIKNDHTIKISTIDINEKDLTNIEKSDFIILSVKPQDAKKAIEEIKNYAKLGGGGKLNSKFWILIMFFIGLAVLGVIILLFLPDIMNMLSGSADAMVPG